MFSVEKGEREAEGKKFGRILLPCLQIIIFCPKLHLYQKADMLLLMPLKQ